jgi:hypothetical protein
MFLLFLYVAIFTSERTGNVLYFAAQDVKLIFGFALQPIFNLTILL